MSDLLEDLSEHSSGSALIGVDFGGGRPEAGFPELADNLPAGIRLLECTPAIVDAVRANRLTAELYSELVVYAAEEAGLEIVAVLGYCAGAMLAVSVAHAFARRTGRTPAVILFDAESVSKDLLRAKFDASLAGLSGHLDVKEFEAARAKADNAVVLDSADIHAFSALLSDEYALLVDAASQRVGLADGAAADMTHRFSMYMRYLAAAGDVRNDWSNLCLHRIRSDGYFPQRPVDRTEELRINVGRAGLLADVRTARIVTQIVDSRK
jgi:hypothetical protein